jgi:hypothetical protein
MGQLMVSIQVRVKINAASLSSSRLSLASRINILLDSLLSFRYPFLVACRDLAMVSIGDVHANTEVESSVASPLSGHPHPSSEDKALYQFLSSPVPLSL